MRELARDSRRSHREPPMTLAAFAFLMAGVLLNAGAQLLLKAGTNVLGVLTLTRDTWPDTLLQMATQRYFVARRRLLRAVAVRLDPRPVARPGVGRLSAAVGRLRRQRDRRALSCSARRSPLTRWLGIGFIVVGVWLVAQELSGRRRDERAALSQVRRPGARRGDRSPASPTCCARAGSRAGRGCRTFERALSTSAAAGR